MEKLTLDLTVDILSRLPTLSLLRSTSVCKLWHHIITTDPIFTTLRNSSSTIYTDALVLTIPCDLSARQLYFTQLVHPHFIKKIDLPSFIHGITGRVYPTMIGVCNGLICLAAFPNVLRDAGTAALVKAFYIINPISNQHLKLPNIKETLSILPASNIVRILYGFGWDKRNQVFKLVVFVFGVHDDGNMLVFTLSSGWRRSLGGVPFMMQFAFGDASKVYVDGCVYWITGAPLPNSAALLSTTDISLVIMSFNLSEEAFSVVQTPELVICGNPFFLNQANYYTLAVLDSCLCWVDSNSEDHIMIWIKKNGQSWTKSFCLQKSLIAPNIFGPVTPIKFEQNGQLFLQYGYRVICYNVQDNTTAFFNVDQEPEGISLAQGFPFVGSFIPINSC